VRFQRGQAPGSGPPGPSIEGITGGEQGALPALFRAKGRFQARGGRPAVRWPFARVLAYGQRAVQEGPPGRGGAPGKIAGPRGGTWDFYKPGRRGFPRSGLGGWDAGRAGYRVVGQGAIAGLPEKKNLPGGDIVWIFPVVPSGATRCNRGGEPRARLPWPRGFFPAGNPVLVLLEGDGTTNRARREAGPAVAKAAPKRRGKPKQEARGGRRFPVGPGPLALAIPGSSIGWEGGGDTQGRRVLRTGNWGPR